MENFNERTFTLVVEDEDQEKSHQEIIKTREQEEKIEREKKEAKERFYDLIEMVSSRYESMTEDMKESFIAHNEEILDSAIELGVAKDLSEDEMKMLEMSAIMHDMTKARKHEEFEEVPFYDLLVHGQEAAAEVPGVLTDEYLQKKGFSGKFEEIRQKVSDAIIQHMGPHPGFMERVLKMANRKLEELGKEKIVHPEVEGIVSETLLAADMKSLASEKGREKIMAIRYDGKIDREQDLEMAKEYHDYGVKLSQGEAALLYAFRSAYEARDMITDPVLQESINNVIEESMERAYIYGKDEDREEVDPKVAFSKKEEYKAIRSEEESRKKENEEIEKIRDRIEIAA